jgi:hypothetical protein
MFANDLLFERAFFDNLTDWMAALEEEEERLRMLGINHYDRELARTYGFCDGDPRRFVLAWNGDVILNNLWLDPIHRIERDYSDTYPGGACGLFDENFCNGYGDWDEFGNDFTSDDFDLRYPKSEGEQDLHPEWDEWGVDDIFFDGFDQADDDIYPPGQSSCERKSMSGFIRKPRGQHLFV